MAIIFELWVECRDEPTAHEFVHHFSNLRYRLLTGRTIQWETHIAHSDSDGVSIAGWSPDLSDMGVRTSADASEATEVGLHLYHHLISAPAFRFARIAWEASIFISHDLPTFVETTATGERQLTLECVLDDALYQTLGAPRSFRSFRPGYWWQPYRGEVYRPLHSNDQPALNTLCRDLFPDYFVP